MEIYLQEELDYTEQSIIAIAILLIIGSFTNVLLDDAAMAAKETVDM